MESYGWERGKITLIGTKERNGPQGAVPERQGSCLQPKAPTAGGCTFCCGGFGYLGNLFLAGSPLQQRACLYLLLPCFQMVVLQHSTWQEQLQLRVAVGSRLCLWSQVSNGGVMMALCSLCWGSKVTSILVTCSCHQLLFHSLYLWAELRALLSYLQQDSLKLWLVFLQASH